jgi:hypothetical protein
MCEQLVGSERRGVDAEAGEASSPARADRAEVDSVYYATATWRLALFDAVDEQPYDTMVVNQGQVVPGTNLGLAPGFISEARSTSRQPVGTQLHVRRGVAA